MNLAKFSFRLQTYLNLKAKIEDMKRNEFGKAVAALEREKMKLAELEQEKKDCIEDFRQKVESIIDTVDLNRYNLFIEMLKGHIKKQTATVAQAEAIVRAKRAELVEAMKDRKILETLKDKEYTQYLSEEKQNEQKMLDDLVSYRYSR